MFQQSAAFLAAILVLSAANVEATVIDEFDVADAVLLGYGRHSNRLEPGECDIRCNRNYRNVAINGIPAREVASMCSPIQATAIPDSRSHRVRVRPKQL